MALVTFRKFLLASIALLPAGTPAFAQSADTGQLASEARSGDELGEIVVTARKRGENLQSVPISITAVSGEQLQSNAIRSMDSFAPSIPNFRFSAQPAATDSYYIRGIGAAPNFGFETAVGLVMDGFFYGKTRIGRAAFLDLERVEVLKGPQGVILGKNNSAGAINLTTAKPTNSLTAYINPYYNFEGDRGEGVEAAVSGPITDTLSFRVAGRYDRGRGFFYNRTFDSHEQRKRDGTVRATLQWKPSSDVTVTGMYQRVDFKDYGNPRELYSCGPGKTAQLSAPGLPSDDCALNFDKATDGAIGASGPVQDYYRTKLDMAHLTVQAQLGEFTLSSLTGYMAYQSIDRFDGDNTPTADSVVITPEDYKQVIQETRLAGNLGNFDITAGLFFLYADHDAAFNFVLPTAGVNLRASGNQKTTTLAPFAEVTYRITPTLDVSVGGRYTYEKKKLHQVYNQLDPVTDALFATVYTIDPRRTERNFSPTADIRWRPAPGAMVYGTFRRGFRGGGFDRFLFAGNQAAAEASNDFDAENVTAFELGGKFELFDNSLRINAALFHSKYKDLQVSAFINAQTFRIDNAASAISKGVELGIDWKPVRSLLLGANLGFLRARYSSFPGAACYTGQTAVTGCIAGAQDLSGRSLPFAPKFTGSFNGTYTIPLSDTLQFQLFGELIHTSGSYLGIDANPLKIQRRHDLINGRVSLGSENDSWKLSFIARNLTDRRIRTAVNNSAPDALDAYVMAPRTLGIQASFRY